MTYGEQIFDGPRIIHELFINNLLTFLFEYSDVVFSRKRLVSHLQTTP